jgi:3-mercaptopropionate dioxygenase
MVARADMTDVIKGIDLAVQLQERTQIADHVKRVLEREIGLNGFDLPAELKQPRGECYARRLLHRGKGDVYEIVAMTWGPGQGTPLHDHAGLWCVECVVQGQMEVIQYRLLDRKMEDGGKEQFCFGEVGKIMTGVGTAGALIPPHEYHVLRNPSPNQSAVTLHVYGGQMKFCGTFTPVTGLTEAKEGRGAEVGVGAGGGGGGGKAGEVKWYRRELRQLDYH